MEISPQGTALAEARPETWEARIDALAGALSQATAERRRADCMARIQTDAVQLALDLLVREPDISGFFRVFIKTLAEESESRGCGVWLIDDANSSCSLWMAYVEDTFYEGAENFETLPLPRQEMAAHLFEYRDGWTSTIEYGGDDPRLPAAVRTFNAGTGVESVIVAPLVLSTGNLGWIALSSTSASACETQWRRAVLDATARQATLALHQSRLAEQSRLEARRQAALEERNRIARDIHDTLTQGFAAILMQLQAAQRSAASLPPNVAASIETAIDLARTHMIEARRSVGALRPQSAADEDVVTALRRIVELSRRTTDVPIELTLGEVPSFGGGVQREIIAIAQEALTNAIRHARAKRIAVHAAAVRSVGFTVTVSDDGRGIAKEHRGVGFGMTSMQERAERIGASLTVVTAPRSGTEVVLAWEPPSFSIPEQAADGV